MQRVRRLGAMPAVAAFALVVLAACGSRESVLEDVTRVPEMSEAAAQATREAPAGGTPEVAEAAAETPAAADASAPAAAAQTAEVVSVDIAFQPAELTIPADTDVTFSLPNQGAAAHNFSIDALGVSVDLPPGGTESVVISAPAGTYEYYCNVPGHKEAGMVGTLTVSADAAPAAAAEGTAEGTAAATPAAAAATSAAATPGMATPAAGAEATPAAVAPAAVAEPVEIVAVDIAFDPNEVTIPADTDVTFSLPNEGAAPHNFSIDALGVSVDIAPGATEDVVINAPAGSYEYYCNVPGHKQAGMVGTLTVSAGAASATPAPPPSPAAGEETTEAAAPAAAEAVEIASIDIAFEPKETTIPADTDVTLSLPNRGAAAHNFSIDALGISVDQAPGATEEIVVNAPAGTYEYYCNVPGHKEAGMVGTLTVE